MNYEVMKQRIRERLRETGQTAKAVSLAIGAHQNFLSALLTDKKKSFAADLLPALAQELDCDATYLLGISDVPNSRGPTTMVAVAGSIEPGVWRNAARDPSFSKRVPMQPDPRYRAEDQQLWLVRGNTLEDIDLSDGGAVLTARVKDLREWFNLLVDDDLVIAERERDGDVLRTVLRVKRTASGLELRPAGGDMEPILWKAADEGIAQTRLAGVVLQIVKFRA